MNKDQALQRLSDLKKEAEEIIKLLPTPEENKLSPEERFWQLCDGLEVKIDNEQYPASTFFFKNGECFFEYNSENKYLYCSHKNIWSVFEIEYSMSYNYIQSMIKNQVEEHFKCKVITPPNKYGYVWPGVENYFNGNGVGGR